LVESKSPARYLLLGGSNPPAHRPRQAFSNPKSPCGVFMKGYLKLAPHIVLRQFIEIWAPILAEENMGFLAVVYPRFKERMDDWIQNRAFWDISKYRHKHKGSPLNWWEI